MLLVLTHFDKCSRQLYGLVQCYDLFYFRSEFNWLREVKLSLEEFEDLIDESKIWLDRVMELNGGKLHLHDGYTDQENSLPLCPIQRYDGE